ncbi:MAG: aminopeptidase [Lachnospiraceae bacterium]|nr:aminopeptidase [Lachnospiraceae bacterium]
MEWSKELLEERLELAAQRITEIEKEGLSGEGAEAFDDYFRRMAAFLNLVNENRTFVERGGLKTASLEELGERNHALYADVLPENYEKSFGNPAYAAKMLGEDYGKLLSFLHRELFAEIVFCHTDCLEDLVIREELFVEVYGAFAEALSENGKLPSAESVRQILYWFASDYADLGSRNLVAQMVHDGESQAIRILKSADLSDLRYLYAYGQYVSDNELEIARFLQKQPQSTIDTMADTYTEGYRIGFEVTGRDLSKKTSAEIMFPIGFERMLQKAVANFEKIGLKAVGRVPSTSIFYRGETGYSTSPNRQYDFDHRNDNGLFMDKAYVQRAQEVLQTAFEEFKDDAKKHAGPAVVEVFGEKDFVPVIKPEAVKLTDEQNDLDVERRMRLRQIQMIYIPEEERSFTIIAFPLPEIKEALPDPSEKTYAEFFEEIIKVNTLDYLTYRNIQATMIEALDQADYCEIKGMNGNRTDLRVNLWKLKDPSKETIFENCVADVNIPVGEVFTSPVLKGTNGTLHVSRVYLNGLEYKNLSILFEDGFIKEYNCSNFENAQENLDFIRDNLLFKRKTLPIGEFAIGTNTTAYVVARKYGVQSKLPILIAEKTGPHFAVGDTCYSHSEDMKVYNPDGKEIVARENEASALRTVDPAKAYFDCHTDVTIPYDELGELTAVKKNGERITIIRNGRFVLPGTEELNKALDSEQLS